MKVLIIGGGAVGLLTAYYCQQEQMDVTVITRRKVQADRINVHGVSLLDSDNCKKTVYPKAATAEEMKSLNADAAFVSLKQTDLTAWISLAKSQLNFTLPLILLLNGKGHVDKLHEAGFSELIQAVVTHGAMRASDTAVRHTGKGTITAEDTQFMKSLSKPFRNHPDFPMKLTSNIAEDVQRKFIVNVTVNPITALYRVRNGELLGDESLLHKAYQLFEEACCVLELDTSYWETVLSVLKVTADNYSSMYVDIESGRETEAEALTGYVIAQAEKKGMNVPYTLQIHHQLKEIERGENNA